MEGTIFIDVAKCVACKACEIQCAVAHSESKNLYHAILEEPLPQTRVKVEPIEELAIPLQCCHCEQAPCVTICPTGALEKQGIEGPVVLHKEHCIGCKWCVLVCPFGVISLSRDGKAIIKCDLCSGREEGPACVTACPTRALRFMPVAELSRERRREVLLELRHSLVAVKKAQLW